MAGESASFLVTTQDQQLSSFLGDVEGILKTYVNEHLSGKRWTTLTLLNRTTISTENNISTDMHRRILFLFVETASENHCN